MRVPMRKGTTGHPTSSYGTHCPDHTLGRETQCEVLPAHTFPPVPTVCDPADTAPDAPVGDNTGQEVCWGACSPPKGIQVS